MGVEVAEVERQIRALIARIRGTSDTEHVEALTRALLNLARTRALLKGDADE